MKIVLVTPASPRSLSGNRTTAIRWASFLRESGQKVAIKESWDGEEADLMIALHARRSHASISAYARSHPNRPLVVVLTGTDLYRDIRTDGDARESLDLATRLIVLQEAGLDELKEWHRQKARVIYQSARPSEPLPKDERFFDICVLGNLRRVKDPFRAALAARQLPNESRIQVLHAGKAQDKGFEEEALSHMGATTRYRWLGELPHKEVRSLLSRSRLLVQSSLMEGGANSVCEALAIRIPVIASGIPGNIGMLGKDYPGYYPVGDTKALTALLRKTERDVDFYRALQEACETRRHLVLPDNERKYLKVLVMEITPENKNRPADV